MSPDGAQSPKELGAGNNAWWQGLSGSPDFLYTPTMAYLGSSQCVMSYVGYLCMPRHVLQP